MKSIRPMRICIVTRDHSLEALAWFALLCVVRQLVYSTLRRRSR